MAKWRTNRSFAGVVSRIQEGMSKPDEYESKVEFGSISLLDIKRAWDSGCHVDYPGGLEQFEKDAMREKVQMLQDRTNIEKGVE